MFPHYTLNKKELQAILSPSINSKNIELFARKALDQEKFKNTLDNYGLETQGRLSPELIERLSIISKEIKALKETYPELSCDNKKKQNLDFNISKIVHENLQVNRTLINNFSFWRWINLNYFIENVIWRWVKDPDNLDNMPKNATTVFGRGFGDRDRRIDIFRYWFISERLYDKNKGYYYIETLAEKAKNDSGPYQDFLNNIIDNNLFSPNEIVSKQMAEIMLIDNKFTTERLIKSFKRYHSYTNRFLVDAEKEIFEKEICI